MYSKFLNLSPDKQERILNAALKEFSQKGYEKASTNEIVKEAEISKGLLFHYFKNKKELFLFLYDHFVEIIMDEFYSKIDWNERDLLMRFREITVLEFELMKKYPDIFNFFMAAYHEESADVKIELEKRNKEILVSSYQKLFTDIDTSKFKQGIDINRAINIIIWTMEGFSNEQQKKEKLRSVDQINMDEILSEINHYLNLLKTFFYA
ncbi:TetR family transcriptional regulator [Bacillus methanolicus PB1]|uniref:TetR family transcriptional regulator n=1 Tax=Bacillus methanolicus PB1 TaxID=997296 RepID=I3E123_BACMT|nr:TetR/AcrR family transcriptional regulator [Bacillus methanolicus]EIJ80194.1 TetR family transcriptional regulator [Bacillus methanolicus PB1]